MSGVAGVGRVQARLAVGVSVDELAAFDNGDRSRGNAGLIEHLGRRCDQCDL